MEPSTDVDVTRVPAALGQAIIGALNEHAAEGLTLWR